MLEIIKKNKKRIIRYAILGFVACLFVVQLPYWLGRIQIIIDTDFKASDVLAFLGNYISALGSIILGWIAIKQTEQANSISEKANRISDRMAELEIAKHIEEHDPVVLVDWVKLHDSSYNNVACKVDFGGQLHYIDAQYENDINEERQCIEINLINTGKSGIYNCKLETVCSTPDELKKGIGFMGNSDAPFALKAGQEINVNFYVYTNVVERFAVKKLQNIQFVLSCVNDFNERYLLTVDIEGAIIHMGNNRYEGQIDPRPHPVKWAFTSEKVISHS